MTILVPGLLLTAIAWLAAWGRFGIVTEFSFFPLWVGYILVLNGISEVLFRDSLIRRMGRSFFGLFVLSVPMWWFFELMNSFVHNWHYIFAHPGSDRPDCCINSRRCIVWREGWKQMNTRPFGSYLANLDT
jgi:hypothetical protein